MTDFYTWCNAKSLVLPTTDENTTRSGQRPQYPDGYLRSQYPAAYLAPTSATSFLDLKNSQKGKDRKDTGGKAAN